MKSRLPKLGWTLLWLVAVSWAARAGHPGRAALFTLVWLLLLWPALQKAWGATMSWLVMTVLYFVGLAPFGLAVRLFSDPLRMKVGPRGTHWIERAPENESLAEAAKQG